MKKIFYSMSKTFLTLSFVIKIAWNFNKFFLVSKVILAIFTGIMPTITVLFSKLIVEQITNMNWRMTIFYIILSSSVSFIISIFILLIHRWQGVNDSLFRNDLFFQVLVKNSKLDLAHLDSPEISTKKQMATASAQGNYINALFSSFFNLLSGIVTLSSVIYVLSSVDIYILLLMLAVIMFQILIIIANNKRNRKKFADEAHLNKEISYYMNVLDDPTYSFQLKLHGLAEWIANKYYKLIMRFNTLIKGYNKSLFYYNLGSNFK